MLLPSETSIAVAPVLLIGFEGNVNCFDAGRGTLTKVALEHVRKASSFEQPASENGIASFAR